MNKDEPIKDEAPWWRSGVLYQIYPRSYADHGGNGVGDLKGITSRLDYIASLGVTAIWISPFFKSPMKDFGYDVEDHRAVDPLFGSPDDFTELIQEAHARGLRVLIDLVLSHTSDTHLWFQEEREVRKASSADRYVWANGSAEGGLPNNWLSIFGGPAWTYEPRRQQYYLHNFLESQPDLNFHNPKVREEALSVARWWLERGVDGFRLDTVNFYFHDQELRNNPLAAQRDQQVVSADNPYGHQDHRHDKNQPEVCEFLSELGELLGEFPGTIALGEIGAVRERALGLMQQYQQPGRLQLSYAFDLLSSRFSADHFRAFIAENSGPAPPVWRCLAFSNHDVRRAATRLDASGENPEVVASMALALLLTLRGTPCLYQGEELGLTEAEVPYERLVDPYGIAFWPEFKGRDGCRTPMPWSPDEPHAGFSSTAGESWLPVAEEHRAQAVERQELRGDSLLQLSRALIKTRSQRAALHSERIDVLDNEGPMLAYVRGQGEAALLCLFNLSAQSQAFLAPGAWREADTLHQGGEASTQSEDGAWHFGAWSWRIMASPYHAG